MTPGWPASIGLLKVYIIPEAVSYLECDMNASAIEYAHRASCEAVREGEIFAYHLSPDSGAPA